MKVLCRSTRIPYGHMDIRSLKCKMLARVRDPFRLADIITEAKILFFFFSCNHTLTTCAVLFPSCLFSPTHEKNSEIRIVIADRFQMRGLEACQVAGSSCVLFAFASFDELIHIGRCGCACKISGSGRYGVKRSMFRQVGTWSPTGVLCVWIVKMLRPESGGR